MLPSGPSSSTTPASEHQWGSVWIEAIDDDQRRVLAANTRNESSQSDTIRLAFIERVEHFLHDGSRRLQIQCIDIC